MADKNEKDKRMTSARVSWHALGIIKAIKKRYKDVEAISTQDDAFLEFMRKNHPELYAEGERYETWKLQGMEFADDEDDNPLPPKKRNAG